jgi:acetylornithine/succinyldiaminopimelate/putrescine aminotransferase
MFAMEHWNVTPDIITGGKALGGGTPVGFFSTTDQIAASYTMPGASTFGGNPVTAQAGLKLLEILQRAFRITGRMGTCSGSTHRSAAKSDMISDVPVSG